MRCTRSAASSSSRRRSDTGIRFTGFSDASSGPSPRTRARRACSMRGRSSRVPSRAASSVSIPRRSDSRRLQSSRAFRTAAWVSGSTHRRPSRAAARRPRTARRPARGVRRDVAVVAGRQPLCARDEARGADRARPDARGRGGRDPPSSAGDVSRAVRATYAWSCAERPHLDRTGGPALRGDGARLARGEDTRARAGVGRRSTHGRPACCEAAHRMRNRGDTLTV